MTSRPSRRAVHALSARFNLWIVSEKTGPKITITYNNMEQIMMGFAALVYYLFGIGVSIFVLRLLWRFVKAHEKLADAMFMMARKPKDTDTP